ncbi:hypothetical protein GCM10027418_14060 [Mariniluteicoccus endophyticus]
MTDLPADEVQPDEPAPAVDSTPAPPAYAVFDITGDDHEAGESAAFDAVTSGHCIVLPTDTVYGIGADAFNRGAVQALLDAKNRGRDMPPPVLIADPAVMMALASDIPDNAKKLAERHWPGALTLILNAQPSLMMDLGDTRGTIAVRVPDHDRTRALLRRTGPLAVSSANISGQPAATSVAEAQEMLGDRVKVYLDGGAGTGPEPSTIVDFSKSEYGKVLRLGRLTLDELRELVPYLEGPDVTAADAEATVAPAEPLAAYAPDAVSGQEAAPGFVDAAMDPDDLPRPLGEDGEPVEAPAARDGDSDPSHSSGDRRPDA